MHRQKKYLLNINNYLEQYALIIEIRVRFLNDNCPKNKAILHVILNLRVGRDFMRNFYSSETQPLSEPYFGFDYTNSAFYS